MLLMCGWAVLSDPPAGRGLILAGKFCVIDKAILTVTRLMHQSIHSAFCSLDNIDIGALQNPKSVSFFPTTSILRRFVHILVLNSFVLAEKTAK